MEQTEQYNNVEGTPSYWSSVAIAALIFAIVTFALQIILGYMSISGTGGMLFSAITGFVVCLIGGFGGMVAVWHYANENDLTMNFGKGAIIGLITGVIIILISVILNQLWHLINPDYQQQIIQAAMERFEDSNMADEQMAAIKDSIEGQFTIVKQIIWGIPIYGILNILTGLLGVQLFAKEEEEDF